MLILWSENIWDCMLFWKFLLCKILFPSSRRKTPWCRPPSLINWTLWLSICHRSLPWHRYLTTLIWMLYFIYIRCIYEIPTSYFIFVYTGNLQKTLLLLELRPSLCMVLVNRCLSLTWFVPKFNLFCLLVQLFCDFLRISVQSCLFFTCFSSVLITRKHISKQTCL